MLEVTQFSDQEVMAEISEFPGYHITSWGRVFNYNTGQPTPIVPTVNSHGVVMIGLMGEGPIKRIQYKRSLALLVAQAFVSPEIESFDTPIHLDGNRLNMHYTNIRLRPLWFARKYMKQFTDDHTTYPHPIQDVETGDIYENSMHAATANGLLDVEIRMSMLTNNYVWPTCQIFRDPI